MLSHPILFDRQSPNEELTPFLTTGIHPGQRQHQRTVQQNQRRKHVGLQADLVIRVLCDDGAAPLRTISAQLGSMDSCGQHGAEQHAMQRHVAQQHRQLRACARGRGAERDDFMLQRSDFQRERDHGVRAERVHPGEYDEAGQRDRRPSQGHPPAESRELLDRQSPVVRRHLAGRRRHRRVPVRPAAEERVVHLRGRPDQTSHGRRLWQWARRQGR